MSAKKSFNISSLSFFAATLLAGCATTTQEFSAVRANASDEEVRFVLGRPENIRESRGARIYRYTFAATGGEAGCRMSYFIALRRGRVVNTGRQDMLCDSSPSVACGLKPVRRGDGRMHWVQSCE